MNKYSPRNIERAHWWMAKALDSLAEADVLIPSGTTRLGAVNRLYYTAHNVAVGLLKLIGNKSKKHSAIINQFGNEWIGKRQFPKTYGKLLNDLHHDRNKADYGEYVPTFQQNLERRRKQVDRFIKRAWKEIPFISTEHILQILVQENPQIRDFSFDIYCPKSYFHHTRFTVWAPKGRITDKWLDQLMSSFKRVLAALQVKEKNDYVIGLNSRVNQYREQHLLMLDFDNMSTLPYDEIAGEPGLIFRTASGFHFIGSELYNFTEWRKIMRKYSRIASKQHCDLSFRRRYGTLRITSSPRKPVKPAYIGRSRPKRM